MKPRIVIGALAVWIAAALGLLISSWLFSGVEVTNFGDALLTAALVAAIEALTWPLIIRFALPITVFTLGLAVLVLNGAIVLVGAAIAPGVEVHGIWAGIGVTIVITATTTVAAAALSIDDEARVARHMVRRATRRAEHVETTDVPGVLFLEVDGLAHAVVQRAMRDGNAPTLASWVRDGSHHLVRWETDWSSQTGACQAGLLHGSNEDMPAFRWWEKDRGKPIVTNHPRDAAELERRISDGRGLLYAGGASRANILSGDAPHSLLTMSTVMQMRRAGERIGQGYFTFFASPYNVARTMLLCFVDIGSELKAAASQRRRDVRPRIHRGWKYALVRAWATVVQLHLQIESVMGDVYAGRPVVYTTFLAYDEVAHHSGIERPETLTVLRHVDLAIARIARAAREGPRPYEIVVLSDHGQTQGATFLQRYGITLEQLVEQGGVGDVGEVAEAPTDDEALGRLSAALTEATQGDSASSRALRVVTRNKEVDGEVRLLEGDEPAAEGGGEGEAELPEVSVMASGCLGLITFPRLPGRVTREQVDERYPRLLATLREHPGIGFVLVRSEEGGAVVLGPRGEHWLDSGRVEGEDPLAPFGEHAAEHVARTDGFHHCPDILVNSAYWAETDEVAAFEELVGSHGGMGGPQAFPFVLAPAHLTAPPAHVIGPGTMHQVLRGWLAELGQDAYAPGGGEPAEEPGVGITPQG